jgi:ABC-type antimicrobial peptide transport system permease subunit
LILLVFLISVLVGVVFGVNSDASVASLDPIESPRYE